MKVFFCTACNCWRLGDSLDWKPASEYPEELKAHRDIEFIVCRTCNKEAVGETGSHEAEG